MKLVSKFAILVVILLCSWAEKAEAQWPNRFYVGSYFVRCDLDTINGIGSWPHYIQAVQNETDNWQGWWNPNPPSEDWRYRILPEVRFDQMEDLGLNMAEFTIQPEHLLSDPLPRNRGNVVTDLNNRIAARAVAGHADLEMCITDPYINAVSGAERLMFHPEVTADFAEPGPFQTADDNDFENFPNLNLRIGRQLGFLEGAGQNCRTLNQSGMINGLTGIRKRELSVCGRYNAEADTSAGKYHLSIVLKSPRGSAVLPADNSPVLLVKLFAQKLSNPGQPDSLVFEVPGNAFRDGSGNPIKDVFEYHLGLVELRLDSLDTGNPRVLSVFNWSDNLVGLPMPSDDTLRMNPASIAIEDTASTWMSSFDISIEYLSGTSGTILVDAVCLSTPGGYALFHPEAPEVEDYFDWTNYNMKIHIQALLYDSLGNPHQHLRMLVGAEQDWYSGDWRASRLVNLELDNETNGSVRLYNATSGWSDVSSFSSEVGEMTEDRVSGFYHYPIHWTLRRPQDPVGDYYSLLYHYPGDFEPRNMEFLIDKYHQFTLARKRYNFADPWIPYIQNQAQSYPGTTGWDLDRLREPTAAELRVQCNLALAFKADGVMFYAFSPDPSEQANPPFWPETRAEWEADPLRSDVNMGTIGFLGAGNRERTIDTNGEGKWDSSRVTIAALKQLGQMMKDSAFTWQGTGLWYANSVANTTPVYITTVIAQRQDNPQPIDPADSTYVVTSEFTSVGGLNYIFVVNGRTRDKAQRHITVKLANLADEWKVTNVLTGDVWIVKPSDTPDATTTANGFTDYFEPGAAGLYRLEPITNQTFAWSGCFDASVYVEPAATLLLDNTHVYNFNQNHGLFVEGTLSAYQTTFGPCDTELGWKGIVARNGGQVSLDECMITGAVSGVTCGSGATATLTGYTQITSAETAMTLLDGTISSTSTIGTNIEKYYLYCVGNGIANIEQDRVIGTNAWGSTALCLFNNGTCNVEESHFRQFWESAYVGDAMIWGISTVRFQDLTAITAFARLYGDFRRRTAAK